MSVAMTDPGKRRALVDKRSLPAGWPTHLHASEFWEHLGPVVGTFGMLEEVLGKAIFALTGSRPIDSARSEQALTDWVGRLERGLTETLNPLIDLLDRALRDHPDVSLENSEELIGDLRMAAKRRNALCHGSWQPPDELGRSEPLFVDRNLQVFDTPVDVAFLQQAQRHACELICAVVDTVTSMGLQFPGSSGPGTPVWE